MPSASLDSRIAMIPSDYRTAIISAEFAVDNKLPLYSGGLGVLAGDWLKEAGDRAWPLVGLGILYHKGYFNQELDRSGRQIELDADFNPDDLGLKLLPVKIKTNIDNRQVTVGAYEYLVGGKTPLILVTTNLPENSAWDRGITARLYDNGHGDRDYFKAAQYRILASGVRILQQLDYDIQTYHLNEGHGAFVALELLNQGLSPDKVRERIWFTTHTPVAAAFDYLKLDQVRAALNGETSKLEPFVIPRFGESYIGTAELAIALSRGINAVSRMHAEVSSAMSQFKGRQVISITNGVHLPSWVHPTKAALYQSQLGNVFENPERFRNSDNLDYRLFEEAHKQAQRELLNLVRERTGIELDEGKLTVGFARRGVSYKRADLLLSDIRRLAEVVDGNAQLIFAGKAPPGDDTAANIIQNIYQRAAQLRKTYGAKVVFVPNYDMELGRALVGGVDLWVNNPERGREASGTSGMKVAANGGVNLSVLDGWWSEGYDGNNGFAIAPWNTENDRETDFRHTLQLLGEGLREYQRNGLRDFRVESMKLGAQFNTHRNLGEYVDKAYPTLEQRLKDERQSVA